VALGAAILGRRWWPGQEQTGHASMSQAIQAMAPGDARTWSTAPTWRRASGTMCSYGHYRKLATPDAVTCETMRALREFSHA
jgi:hypothetical protein